MKSHTFMVGSVKLPYFLPICPVFSYSFYTITILIKNGIDRIRAMTFLGQLYCSFLVF